MLVPEFSERRVQIQKKIVANFKKRDEGDATGRFNFNALWTLKRKGRANVKAQVHNGSRRSPMEERSSTQKFPNCIEVQSLRGRLE
jgi:type II secretory pathway component PulK